VVKHYVRKLYGGMASDVKGGVGKNAMDGIFNFSAIGCRIKVAHGNFVTSLHYEFSFLT